MLKIHPTEIIMIGFVIISYIVLAVAIYFLINYIKKDKYINSHKTIHSSTTIPINLWLRRQNVLMDNGIDQA